MRHQREPERLELIRALARFRAEFRSFLAFSEEAAVRAGISPQQHQMLLQVAGALPGEDVTISLVAERLGLRHHSAVELCDRCERADLLHRSPNPANRRQVLLTLTPQAVGLLDALSVDHARELDELAPRMIAALNRIRRARDKAVAGSGSQKENNL